MGFSPCSVDQKSVLFPQTPYTFANSQTPRRATFCPGLSVLQSREAGVRVADIKKGG